MGWSSVSQMGKSVAKGIGKLFYTPPKTIIENGTKKTVEEAKGILPFVKKHPKGVLGTSLGIYGYTSGKGICGAVSSLTPGSSGITGFLSDVFFGKDTDGKDAAEKAGEVLIGKDNTKKVSDAVSSGVGAVTDAVSKGLEMVKGATNTIGDMFSGIFSFFGGGMNPASADSAVSEVGGFQQMLSSVFGRNVNLSIPTIAMTVLGAWLGFGNHGFTGKIAGALLGALGLKNMFNAPSLTPALANVSQEQSLDIDNQKMAAPARSERTRAVSPAYDNSGNSYGDVFDDGIDNMNGDDLENSNRRTGFRR